jgi:transcriptional regulator with XRE-family HTH domain
MEGGAHDMEQASDKTDKLNAANLAIDGSRIRTVRETKKLTQLYVASVVGVTTDTISRWENNRYPSIKRENAEKLASALEVNLEEILQQEEQNDEVLAAPPVSAVRSARRLLLFGLAGLAILLLTVFLFTQSSVTAPTATRWIPRFAAPGEIIPVQIKVTRRPGENLGFILKETLPDGFRLVSALPPSSVAEPAGSDIKWLIPGGNGPVTVSYTMQIPTSHAQHKEEKLRGALVLHTGDANRTEAVGGSGSVMIGPYHWADGNGDGRIDDDEIMPAYYICEEMKGLGLDWKTIEAIWSGKGYGWNQQSGFTVLK